jgi:DNA transposition AAA+ family ATPase
MQTLEAPKRATTPTAEALDREPGASVLNPRCNVPIDLRNWEKLEEKVREELVWFHQHIFDENLSNDDAAKALGYDWSTVYRCLKGTYEGNWENVRQRILKYRAIWRDRRRIQRAQFVPNKNTKLIWDALDYMMASNTIVLITGPARSGKSLSTELWRDQNNSGRTILFNTPVKCTPMSLLRTICETIGRRPGAYEFMLGQIRKALNKGRHLLADEAHFLLTGRNHSPICMEILRRFHDETECGLGLIATSRFGEDLAASNYQFEQLLGRIDQPVVLFRELEDEDIRPLLEQYFVRVTDLIMETSLAIVNDSLATFEKGRYGALVGLLRRASRMSADERGKRKMTEQHFTNALAVRNVMMGQRKYAKH